MGRKALVVDNDFYLVEFLTELLEERGYQVFKAYDGKEGISKLEKETFDILIVDLLMPKIDGKQMIKFVRSKYSDRPLPIIALSEVLAEQIKGLNEIEADYLVTKAPIEKMTEQVTMLLDRLEKQPIPSRTDKKIYQPDELVPRQASEELIKAADFYQAVVEGIAMGLLVLDKDTSVICANTLALDIINRPYEDVLNRKVVSLFPYEESARVLQALKSIKQSPDGEKADIILISDSGTIRLVISILRVVNETEGWILGIDSLDV
ncbi:MAG: response regulator [Desulfatiglans sp.]|nr:response regulator [Thermodesulfobacteriota bacterium]MEE4354500.1 response regulator [Desulfatiglans sp.]